MGGDFVYHPALEEVKAFMEDVVKFHSQSVVADSRTRSRDREWLRSLGRKARRSMYY